MGTGFQITFNNGYTVSVQFGRSTYCDQGETTAEVAAWGSDRNQPWVKIGEFEDDIRAHCTPNEVLEIMNTVANLENK